MMHLIFYKMLFKIETKRRYCLLTLITIVTLVFCITYLISSMGGIVLKQIGPTAAPVNGSGGIILKQSGFSAAPIIRKIVIDEDGNEVPVFGEDTLFPKPGGGYCFMTNITDKEQYFRVVENPNKTLCDDLRAVALYKICMDNFKKQNNCSVISFGISFDFGYEDGLINIIGCQAYSFDPTMDLDNHLRVNGKDKFFNLGLSSFEGIKTISYVGRKNRLAKVDRYVNIIKMLGLAQDEIDFFKLDIEGSELDFFLDTASTHPELLQNIKQVQLEFHHMEKEAHHSGNRRDTSQFDMMKIIDILHCHGFALAHSNWCRKGHQTYEYNGKRRCQWYITTWIRV